MERNIFFTVVIPTYNRASLIAKTIESVLRQTFQDFEIIVVDDGSTDNTAEVVTAFEDRRIKYVRKKNEERAAARNAGARLARGEFVTFLDSDDLFYENHLQKAFEAAQKFDQPEWFHLGYESKLKIRYFRTIPAAELTGHSPENFRPKRRNREFS